MSASKTSGLGFLDVQEVLLGLGRSPVPGAGAVPPLDAGEVLRLGAADVVLQNPVGPQALVVSVQRAGEGLTADDLYRDPRS